MSYYKKHVFVCNNQKMSGKKCCAEAGAADAFSYLKDQLLKRELHGPDKIRVSKSGCLGRCAMGPCLVVYPEGVWYTYQNHHDLDEIVQMHLVNGNAVPRLSI